MSASHPDRPLPEPSNLVIDNTRESLCVRYQSESAGLTCRVRRMGNITVSQRAPNLAQALRCRDLAGAVPAGRAKITVSIPWSSNAREYRHLRLRISLTPMRPCSRQRRHGNQRSALYRTAIRVTTELRPCATSFAIDEQQIVLFAAAAKVIGRFGLSGATIVYHTSSGQRTPRGNPLMWLCCTSTIPSRQAYGAYGASHASVLRY